MRILIADDHAVVRQGLKQILAEAFKRASFGEAENSQQALERVRKEHWDIVILDLTMPGQSGLEVLKDIKQSHPSLPVLMLSMHPEDQFAVRMLKTGAAGYLTKDSSPTELVKAVGEVIAGRRYLNPEVIEGIVNDLDSDQPDRGPRPHESLSDREYQVMRMIASGLTVSQIAQKLSLNVKTISTFRARVLKKMEMKTTAELMHYAIQRGLVD